jgi:hypothetical protein
VRVTNAGTAREPRARRADHQGAAELPRGLNHDSRNSESAQPGWRPIRSGPPRTATLSTLHTTT